jgi:hypothetical protein
MSPLIWRFCILFMRRPSSGGVLVMSMIWECRRRDPPADSRDGAREFPLGCTTHPRRTAETRHHYLAGHCITLHAGVARRRSEAEMADICAEPRCRDRTLEGHVGLDLRSWSHVVKRRAAAFAATALAGSPCWRMWYLAGVCQLLGRQTEWFRASVSYAFFKSLALLQRPL